MIFFCWSKSPHITTTQLQRPTSLCACANVVADSAALRTPRQPTFGPKEWLPQPPWKLGGVGVENQRNVEKAAVTWPKQSNSILHNLKKKEEEEEGCAEIWKVFAAKCILMSWMRLGDECLIEWARCCAAVFFIDESRRGRGTSGDYRLLTKFAILSIIGVIFEIVLIKAW